MTLAAPATRIMARLRTDEADAVRLYGLGSELERMYRTLARRDAWTRIEYNCAPELAALAQALFGWIP